MPWHRRSSIGSSMICHARVYGDFTRPSHASRSDQHGDHETFLQDSLMAGAVCRCCVLVRLTVGFDPVTPPESNPIKDP